MKKLLTAATLAAALPQAASALPLVDLYAGGYYWDQSYSGNLKDSGQEVDIDRDLNVDKTGNNVFYAAFEHAVPVIPNIKIKSSAIQASGKNGQVSSSFELGGQSFPVALNDVKTDADFSHTDLTLYWSPPLPIVTLDFGVTARQFDGYVKMSSAIAGEKLEEDFNVVIPMAYAKVGADIPLTGLSVGGDMNLFAIGGSGVKDFDLNLTYVLPIIPLLDVGLSAGYRSFSLDLDPDDYGGDEDDLKASAAVAGPYFGLSLHL